jgi:hypothetical protein
MSWDVLILNRDGTPPSLVDVPDEWMPKPMGDAAAVRAGISAVLPVDWSGPNWGLYRADDFSIEFNVNTTGLVDGVTLHIRGAGDPLPTIVGLCSANGWVALDYSTGQLMDLVNPSRESWLAFQRFRDRGVRHS